MGCPSECYIGEELVFSISTHDPDTSGESDASAISWVVYEDDDVEQVGAGDEIATGVSMTKVDGTTGEYVQKISITSPTYTIGKNYTVFIKATVNGEICGIVYTFKARNSIHDANIVQIYSDAGAAVKLKSGMAGAVTGTVVTQDLATQLTIEALTPDIKAHDIIQNRVLTFTSGDANGQSVLISNYARNTDTTGVITTSVMLGTITASDEFIIA